MGSIKLRKLKNLNADRRRRLHWGCVKFHWVPIKLLYTQFLQLQATQKGAGFVIMNQVYFVILCFLFLHNIHCFGKWLCRLFHVHYFFTPSHRPLPTENWLLVSLYSNQSQWLVHSRTICDVTNRFNLQRSDCHDGKKIWIELKLLACVKYACQIKLIQILKYLSVFSVRIILWKLKKMMSSNSQFHDEELFQCYGWGQTFLSPSSIKNLWLPLRYPYARSVLHMHYMSSAIPGALPRFTAGAVWACCGQNQAQPLTVSWMCHCKYNLLRIRAEISLFT